MIFKNTYFLKEKLKNKGAVATQYFLMVKAVIKCKTALKCYHNNQDCKQHQHQTAD